LWSFAPLPGTPKEGGIIDRTSATWGNCSMMLSGAKDQEKAWKFLKWWGSKETQVRFGRELEAVMGASARYATANVEAFRQLAWSVKDAAAIEEQWKWVIGIPEVPGGYYTQRHVVNAFRNVVMQKEDPRETLLDYTRTINDEITKKRLEFGLD